MGVYLATVSSIDSLDENGNPATARVLPHTAGGVVTMPFAVYWPLRAGDGAVSVGDEVICLQLDDGSGLILSRPDGTFTQTIGGTTAAQGDFTAAGASLKGHTYAGAHGETAPPTA